MKKSYHSLIENPYFPESHAAKEIFLNISDSKKLNSSLLTTLNNLKVYKFSKDKMIFYLHT